MPEGFNKVILAQTRIPGAIAEMVECHYEPNAEVTEHFSTVMLRWRLSPQIVRLKAWQKESVPLPPGRLTLFPANADAGVVASGKHEKTRCFALHMMPQWLDEISGAKKGWLSDYPQSHLNICNPAIENSMQKAAEELMSPGSYSNLLLEAYNLSIAAHLFRHLDQNRPINDAKAFTLAAHRVQRIEEIFLHSDRIPSLEEIAAELGVGVNRLREVFKKSTGKTLFKFVEEVRISKAKSFIKDNKLPLKQISHQLGFCSPAAFSTAFRNATGMTPREYRNSQFF